MKNKNIVMISDDVQIDFLLSTFFSISKMKNNFNLILIGNNLSNSSKLKIKRFEQKIQKIKFIEFEFNEENYIESKLDLISDTTNIRIYLSSILEESNVLYLDNDIFIDGDLNHLFNFVKIMGSNKNYAAEWPKKSGWTKKINLWSDFKEVKRYFNAGVLYLNLDLIRENNEEFKMMNFYKKNKEKITMADQDIMNAVLNFKPFPWFWNIAKKSWKKNYSFLFIFNKLRITHFLGVFKPWNSEEKIQKEKNIQERGKMSASEVDSQYEARIKWRKNFNEFKKIMEISKNDK